MVRVAGAMHANSPKILLTRGFCFQTNSRAYRYDLEKPIRFVSKLLHSPR
jgi:hypothetical protein